MTHPVIIRMLDVEALERLRDELDFKESSMRRIHNFKEAIMYYIKEDDSVYGLDKQISEIGLLKWDLIGHIKLRKAWLSFDLGLKDVLPNADVRQLIWDHFPERDEWVKRINAYMPTHPIPPPCSLVFRKGFFTRRWKVRQKWVHLIRKMPMIDSFHWMCFWGGSSYFGAWLSTYQPFRLKT